MDMIQESCKVYGDVREDIKVRVQEIRLSYGYMMGSILIQTNVCSSQDIHWTVTQPISDRISQKGEEIHQNTVIKD